MEVEPEADFGGGGGEAVASGGEEEPTTIGILLEAKAAAGGDPWGGLGGEGLDQGVELAHLEAAGLLPARLDGLAGLVAALLGGWRGQAWRLSRR